MNKAVKTNSTFNLHTIGSSVTKSGRYLITWLILDGIYVISLFTCFPDIHISWVKFLLAHGFGIIIATMVMFTGLGAGVLWIPLLTFLNVKPADAVPISIFTQIAGKGMGSFLYYRSGLIDIRITRYFIPFVLIGVALGFGAGFVISRKYEKLLLYLFVGVAVYLLLRMLNSLNWEPEPETGTPDPQLLKKSRMIIIVSSFFTGLLSIGNSDWLIPYMERHFKIPTSRAIATGLFIMFCSSLFFLALSVISIYAGIETWPESSPLLPATCSGVIIGGQIGTRLIRFQWLKNRQKHAFILMLGLSIIHLLW